MNNKYGVVIVSYYPTENLIKLICKLYNFDSNVNIVIIDNTGEENEIISKLKRCYNYCEIVMNKDNMGIASALNTGINKFYKKGFQWVLTFDQDSLITANIVEYYFDFIRRGIYKKDEIGILSTNYLDINTGKLYYPKIQLYKEVRESISSGSLININIFIELGKYKDYYFIDQVDNEYCIRLIKNNKKIILLPNNMMAHSLGNITNKHFLWKSFYLYNQNPIRYYYRTRNTIYIIREYNDMKITSEKIKQLFIDFLKILFEDNKKNKISNYFKGIFDGLIYNIDNCKRIDL